MTARIYTAAEAKALLEAIRHGGEPCPPDCNGACVVAYSAALMRLRDAAPDLAASVAFHARRAEKAEAALTEATDRARDAEAERAAAEAALTAVWQAITDDDLPRLPGGDGLVVDAEAVGRRVAAVVAERDAALAHAEELTRALREAQDAIRAEVANAAAVDEDSRAVVAQGVERMKSMRAAIVDNLREWARQSAHRTGNYADALNAAADEIAAGRTP